jgi:large subunit ribosomal protein L23
MKDAHTIIIRPHITEKTVALSYGDPNVRDENLLVRKYTFVVAKDANKIEIKGAIEAIYNAGKKPDQAIKVEDVHTIRILGKLKKRGFKRPGYQPDQKKAIVTLAKGQMLEDYGV